MYETTVRVVVVCVYRSVHNWMLVWWCVFIEVYTTGCWCGGVYTTVFVVVCVYRSVVNVSVMV